MQRNSGAWWLAGSIVALLVIVWVAWALLSPSATSTDITSVATTTASDADAVSQAVQSFGMQLQTVSLLAPNASTTIAAAYAPYVDPTLLLQWEHNPQSAPGRLTSSPWPDHIEIDNVAQNGTSRYGVSGNIVMMTSAGQSGAAPFSATLTDEGGTWYITSFSESTSTAPS